MSLIPWGKKIGKGFQSFGVGESEKERREEGDQKEEMGKERTREK